MSLIRRHAAECMQLSLILHRSAKDANPYSVSKISCTKRSFGVGSNALLKREITRLRWLNGSRYMILYSRNSAHPASN